MAFDVWLAVLTCFDVLPHGVRHIPLQLLAGHALEAGVPVEGVQMPQDGVATVRMHPTPLHAAGILAAFACRADQQVVCFWVLGWALGLEERRIFPRVFHLADQHGCHAASCHLGGDSSRHRGCGEGRHNNITRGYQGLD